MIDDDVDDVDVTYSQKKSGGVQIRVNTTCRNYGGVRTPRTPMDQRHWYVAHLVRLFMMVADVES